MPKNLILRILAIFLIIGIAALIIFLWQKRYSKKVFPKNESQTKGISFLVFGDSGSGSTKQKKLASLMLKYPFDLVLHTGDVAYPYGSTEFYQWNFFQIYSEHLKRGKIYPAPGNHDYQNDGLISYLEAFNLPTNAISNSDKERYYSFDKGNVHFIALDTNTPLDQVSPARSDDMADWLEKDLSARKDIQWTVVYFHHPAYSSGSVHGGDLRVQEKIVPILEKYRVDIVFSGHEHHFERSCPIKKGVCAEGGIQYIVTGGGGAGLYDFAKDKPLTLASKKEFHFMNVVADNCQMNIEAVGEEGDVFDESMIKKC